MATPPLYWYDKTAFKLDKTDPDNLTSLLLNFNEINIFPHLSRRKKKQSNLNINLENNQKVVKYFTNNYFKDYKRLWLKRLFRKCTQ